MLAYCKSVYAGSIPVPASNKIKYSDDNYSQISGTQFCGVHQRNHRGEHSDWICNVRRQRVWNFHRCAFKQQHNALPAQFRFRFLSLIVHFGYEGEC